MNKIVLAQLIEQWLEDGDISERTELVDQAGNKLVIEHRNNELILSKTNNDG